MFVVIWHAGRLECVGFRLKASFSRRHHLHWNDMSQRLLAKWKVPFSNGSWCCVGLGFIPSEALGWRCVGTLLPTRACYHMKSQIPKDISEHEIVHLIVDGEVTKSRPGLNALSNTDIHVTRDTFSAAWEETAISLSGRGSVCTWGVFDECASLQVTYFQFYSSLPSN